MHTISYTSTGWDHSAMAAGFESSSAKEHRSTSAHGPAQGARHPGGENVIDLTAWLEQAQDEPETADWLDEEPDEDAPAQGRARRKDKRSRAMFAAELTATLSVAAVMAALTIRVLLF